MTLKTALTAILILCSFTSARDPLVKKILTNAKQAELDGNGKVYYLDEKLNLCAYNSRTDSTKKFSVSNYGMDPIIDAANPLEVFIFFPLTGKLVVFDNQLNIQTELNVFAAGYIQPAGFGRANDGNIWLLDKNTATLKKADREGNILTESIILEGLRTSDLITRIYDNGEMVFVEDAEKTVFVFDKNGIQKEKFTSNGNLLGYGNEEIYFTRGRAVVRKTKPFAWSVADTVFTAADTVNVMRVNSGFILESSPSALLLHPRL